MVDRSELAGRFREFEQTCRPRAPLYERLAHEIADDEEMLALLDEAPDEQRLPVLLLAAIHLQVLEGHGGDAARFYPNVNGGTTDDGDPYPAVRRLALDRRDAVRSIVATRSTQTNEIGRCALALPALVAVEAESRVGGPLALVDVGASAGLNLLLPTYSYDYGTGAPVGGPSPIVLSCALRGSPAGGFTAPTAIPRIAGARGLDASPIDLDDDTAVQWLEACVWPDNTDRFARLVAAIERARIERPSVTRGDAVRDVATLVAASRDDGHPVVLTSWVLNYLPTERQRAFVAELDRLGASDDLSWVVAEAPAETAGLPIPTTRPAEALTVVSLVTWRDGVRTVRRLGTAHPHGYWLHWD